MTVWASAGAPTLGEPDAWGAAVGWIQNLFLGSTATAIAVIAVASIGLLMLSGRLPVRRGLTVLCGCFILFGAASIAAGLRGAATAISGPGAARSAPYPAVPAAPEQTLAAPPPAPVPADPYAGASVRR